MGGDTILTVSEAQRRCGFAALGVFCLSNFVDWACSWRALDSVSAPDLVKAVLAYHFPMSEPIFSWPLSAEVEGRPHIEWGGIARPTDNSAYRSVGEFWASALYNCLENEGIDEQFKTVGNASIFEPVDLAITSRQLETLFPSVISGLAACYQSLRFGGLYGLVGTDARGLFALVWQEKQA